ncbi:hypothetical protein [Streptomyces sp. NPDC001948]
MHSELHALKKRADEARRVAGLRSSQKEVEKALKAAPYSIAEFRGKFISEWVPEDASKARIPSDADAVWPLVRLWSAWANETEPDQRYWGGLVEKAQPPRPRRIPESGTNPALQRRERVFRRHWTWIEEIRPDQLLDREEELRDLEEFCTAADAEDRSAYAWWQAEPWAGKSALMAEFVVRRRPPNVEVASYFIVDRFGNNERDSFLEEVARQLAAVADRDALPSGVRPEDFPELCQAAAEACLRRGRRLVLLVDGLDEDRGAGPDGLSIAALLPRKLPFGMRVVITGRPNPPVPQDVHEDHPLRNPGIVRPLTTAPEARVIRDRAEKELQRLLKDRPVGNRLLGLLAVARGGLTSTDLAKLVDVQPHEIRELLRGITGRSFVAEDRGYIVGEQHAKAGSRAYVLGHSELLKAALDGLGNAVAAEYEARLHSWADDYRAQGWPADTPSYLLCDYTSMLRSKGNAKRLAAFILDPRRQRALLDRGLVDTAVSEVELTRQQVERETPGDLGTLAALAVSRAVLAARAAAMPPSIPVAFARLGHSQRAMDLALTSPDSAGKAIRLAQVARVLTGTNHKHATQAAKEAAQWAGRARQESWSPDDHNAEVAAGEAAVALIAVGEDEQGCELLGSLRPATYGDGTFRCEMTVEASLAVGPHNAALAEELLDQAESHVDEIVSGFHEDPTSPIAAWSAIAGAVGPERRARLYGRISEYANTGPSGVQSAAVLATAASTLVGHLPDEAAALAQRARRHLGVVLRASETSQSVDWLMNLGSMLTSVAQALVDTGSTHDARELVASVPDSMRTGLLGEDIPAGARSVIDGVPRGATREAPAEALAQQACRLAEEGRPDEAKGRLHEAMESFAQSPEGVSMRRPWLIPLAGALAAIGDLASGERLARSISAPGTRGEALAVVATASAAAGRSTEVRRLAHEGADLAAALEGADDYSILNGVPGLYVDAVKTAVAHALASVGEIGRASSLIGEAEKAEKGARSAFGRARLALAAGLRMHAPNRTARLLQEARDDLLAAHEDRARRLDRSDASPTVQQRLAESAWSGLVTEHAELLVAAGTADRTCRDWLRQALREALSRPPQARSPEDDVVIVILAARRHPDSARRKLRRLEAEVNPYQYPEAAVGCAVAHAVLGDVTAAWCAAQGHAVPTVRTEALASVAACLARVPADLFSAITPSDSDSFRRVVHALALIQAPGTGPDLGQSHRFLRAALAGDGWHHALATLAHVAPDAVSAVRDVSFAHLALGGTAPSTSQK